MSTQSLDAYLAAWADAAGDRVFLGGGQRITFAEAHAAVSDRAAQLLDVRANGLVIVDDTNDADWVLAVLACVRAQRPVALMPSGLTTHERAGLEAVWPATTRMAGRCIRNVATSSAPNEQIDGTRLSGVVAFASSGSTGAPRFVLRAGTSLAEEGERYRALWQVTADDVILGAAAMSHAYGFGAALAAAVVSGCSLVVSRFQTARRLSHDLVEHRTTIVPLVPPMATALAALDGGRPQGSNVRVAMVGAGRTSVSTARAFRSKWGVGISHNYGSSETGAILSALSPSSSTITGFPMLGVECCLSYADHDPESTGQLWVSMPTPPLGYVSDRGVEPARLAPSGWWPMGDLAVRDADGCYTIVGRLGDLIRRGGHTISPHEIESALLSHLAVEAVVVRARHQADGDDSIEAHVQIGQHAAVDVAQLRDHVAHTLSSHKCPHHWQLYRQLPRTWSSKPAVRQLTRPSDAARPDGPLALLGDWRLAEALNGADRVGLLDQLAAGPATAGTLAGRLGLDVKALTFFLRYLGGAGAITCDAETYTLAVDLREPWVPVAQLESALRQSWLCAESIVAVLRDGLTNRPFERLDPPAGFSEVYANTICGPAHDAVALALTRHQALPARANVLEIGRGIGRVAAALVRRDARCRAQLHALAPPPALVWDGWKRLPQAGPVAVRTWDTLDLPVEEFDLIVLSNCIHWLPAGEFASTIARLASALKPGGRLAINDCFVPDHGDQADGFDDRSAFLLDWMVCGGCHWLALSDVLDALAAASFTRVQARAIGKLPIHLVTADRSVDTASDEHTYQGERAS